MTTVTRIGEDSNPDIPEGFVVGFQSCFGIRGERRLPVDTETETESTPKTALVMLRFFAGLATAKTAMAICVSASTAENDRTYARSRIRLEMAGRGDDRQES
jgi:DNA-directed RNA polymerase specialized sigma24 family protein